MAARFAGLILAGGEGEGARQLQQRGPGAGRQRERAADQCRAGGEEEGEEQGGVRFPEERGREGPEDVDEGGKEGEVNDIRRPPLPEP